MANEIPATTVPCDGCGEELNLLAGYLNVMLKPQRSVLVMDESETENIDEVPEINYSLGTKSGRGVIKKYHDFDCLEKWVGERKGLKPKLELHKEDEVYVPEDNPDDEEIARREAEAQKAEQAVVKATKGGEK